MTTKLNSEKNSVQPLVSVLIPARNEETVIADLLNDLLHQDYKNLEIIVYNDESTDKTDEVVKIISKQHTHIKLIQSNGLPKNWLGKNHACYNLAQIAKGKYFLFLDADVRIKNDLIARAIKHVQEHNLDLLSIFPKQILVKEILALVIPLMNSILLSLLPLFLVKKSKFHSLSAANGQFMLFNSETYKKVQPHKQCSTHKTEDIAIARLLKKLGYRTDCKTGDESIQCKMYNNYYEAVHGFTKNLPAFFGGSYIVALLYWLIDTIGFLLIILYLNIFWLIIYLGLIVIRSIIVSCIENQNKIKNILYLIPKQLVFGHILYLSLIKNWKKGDYWKERNIYINFLKY